MEGISAQGLDNPNLNPDKRRSVEHLKEMRDVFTPFVKKFSELFKGEIHSLDLEDINTPEFIPSELYKNYFLVMITGLSTVESITNPFLPDFQDSRINIKEKV